MPQASDGKTFPYTPQGIKDYNKYEAMLTRKNESMGNKKTKDSSDEKGSY